MTASLNFSTSDIALAISAAQQDAIAGDGLPKSQAGAAAEAIKAMRLAETEANLAQIHAEMVKPSEKISAISINQISGLARSGQAGGGPTSQVTQTVDAIMDMVVLLPAIKKLRDEIGVNMDVTALEPKDKPHPDKR